MTIAFWCVFIAGVLPICWQSIAKLTILRDFKNSEPRLSLSQAKGVGQRASWAHDNSWEAFGPFAAAVIIAHLCQVSSGYIDQVAVIFIIARILYGFCYLFDQSILRTAVWFIGFGCVAALYVAAWMV